MSDYQFTAKYLLEVGRDREQLERHASRLAEAIRRLRNTSALRQATKLRATPEFAELCEAWRAYADEVGIREKPDEPAPDKWQ